MNLYQKIFQFLYKKFLKKKKISNKIIRINKIVFKKKNCIKTIKKKEIYSIFLLCMYLSQFWYLIRVLIINWLILILF